MISFGRKFRKVAAVTIYMVDDDDGVALCICPSNLLNFRIINVR